MDVGLFRFYGYTRNTRNFKWRLGSSYMVSMVYLVYIFYPYKKIII